MRLFTTIVPVLLASLCLGAGEEALPVWPAPGARFPAPAPAAPQLSATRVGTAVWEQPPAVLSPYETSWYDYQPTMWGVDKRIKDPQAYYQILRKMYVRAALCYSDDSPTALGTGKMPFYCTNLTNQLYLGNKEGGKVRERFKKARTRENCVRLPSLEDPTTDQSERNRATGIAKTCAPLLPLAYDLRDEATYAIAGCSPHDLDFSPVSLAHFRKWLRAKYGTLEALNTEWQTKFASWNAVMPLMTDEIQKREFPRIAQMNLAPWADHREYNDDTYLAAVSRYRDAVHSVDPGAPVGFSGNQMPSAWGGFDYWKIGNTVSWVEHYQGQGTRELFRSFCPRPLPAMASVHYKVSVDDGLRRCWSLVLHGDTGGLVWPYGKTVGPSLLLDVSPDGIKLTKDGEILKGIFQEMRGGIPCLLNHADAKTDAIGVLYSHASIRADWMIEVKRDGPSWYNRNTSWESSHNYFAAAHEGYHKTIEDLGYQFTCFAGAQVEDGALLKRGVKLLLVPRGLALSKKECEGLRAFVENGGVLVTDLLAGRMNENCRVWPEGQAPLDDLLGLKRAPFTFEEEKKEETDTRYEGGFGYPVAVTMEQDFGGLKAGETLAFQGFQEPKLQAGAAKALAKTAKGPALLEHAVGKGFAYTLNFDLPNYLPQRNDKNIETATAPQRRLFAALCAKAGLVPAVQVRRKGKPDAHPAGLETFTFEQGGALYAGVHVNGSVKIELDLSDSGPGVADVGHGTLDLKLPRKGYVTEMRSGKAFGLADAVQVEMAHDRPVLLSVLPYEVKALNVDAGAGKLADGKLAISVSIEAGGKLCDHVVHAELVDAQGEAAPESVINIPLPKGAYKGALDFSFVPGAGPWKLALRDVASGKTAEVNVSK